MSLVTGWSLGGRGIRMKYAIRLVLCVVCFACLTAVNMRAGQAATWQWVHSTDRYSEYIDASALPKNPVKNEMVIAWTKVVDSWTGIIYEYKLVFNFQEKSLYKRAEAVINKDNRPLKYWEHEGWGKHDGWENIWTICDDPISDFYWYVRDYVNKTNDFAEMRDYKNRLVYLGNGFDNNGKNKDVYIDIETLNPNNDVSNIEYTLYTIYKNDNHVEVIRFMTSSNGTLYPPLYKTRTSNGEYKVLASNCHYRTPYRGSLDDIVDRALRRYYKLRKDTMDVSLAERKADFIKCYQQEYVENGESY